MNTDRQLFQLVELESSGHQTKNIIEIESYTWERAIDKAKKIIGPGARTIGDGLIIMKANSAWRIEKCHEKRSES